MRRIARDHVLVLIAEDEHEWSLSAFELALGGALLAGSDRRLAAARSQLRSGRAMKRRLTGLGFSLELYVPDDAPPGDPALIATPLGDAVIQGEGLGPGATAVIIAEKGRLVAIEACLDAGAPGGWAPESAERFLRGEEPSARIIDGEGCVWFEGGRAVRES